MQKSQQVEIKDLPAARKHEHVWTGGPRRGGQLRGKYRERTIDRLIVMAGGAT